MEVFIMVLDMVRVIYAAAGLFSAGLLAYRSKKWMARFHEPALMHLATMFFVASAAVTGIVRLGEPMTVTFPLNVIGVLCLIVFFWKVPEERTISWREERGDPPDWDARFGDN